MHHDKETTDFTDNHDNEPAANLSGCTYGSMCMATFTSASASTPTLTSTSDDHAYDTLLRACGMSMSASPRWNA